MFSVSRLYYDVLTERSKIGGGVVEWLTRGFKPCQGQAVVSLGKKLYTDCSVLVGSRNGLESVPICYELSSHSN